MKSQAKQELRLKNISQLQSALAAAVKELATLRLELKTGQLKNPHLVSQKRKEIAVIKTLITEKKLTANSEIEKGNKKA
jgi:large subunit ribosomal protein L29